MVVKLRRALKLLTILVIISVLLIKRYSTRERSDMCKVESSLACSNIKYVENNNRYVQFLLRLPLSNHCLHKFEQKKSFNPLPDE